jgi:glycosyltransferase involved in cell wall biosynthesis
MAGLAIIETHPIQYHAPVYRTLQQSYGVPVTAIYGSDFSVVGYHDHEFAANFSWDTDLISGYTSIFLSQVQAGGARMPEQVTTRGLRAALRQSDPSVIMLVGYSPLFYQTALAHALVFGRPLMFRADTTNHAVHRSLLKQRLREISLRFLYARCNKILYVGQRSLDHFRSLGCTERQLVFAPYCVDSSVFQLEEDDHQRLRTETRRKLGIADDQVILLFSGKLSPRKAPERILSAVKSLPAERRHRITVLFLGDGELRENLRQLAQAEPTVDIRLLGFQNQRALSPYYHAADAFVLPSQIGETWGLVVNEALHHGLPCILSDQVGCAPDFIEPGLTGEMFQSGSVAELSGAIERALGLVGRPDVQRRCREKVSAYTPFYAAKGIAMAYNAILQKNGALKINA